MRISDVIRRKGDLVVTIRPDDTVEHLLAVLEERGIGALVVSEDGQTVAGIVSERDVVRHLHRSGAEVLSGPVSAKPKRRSRFCTACPAAPFTRLSSAPTAMITP